jgi:hypothetical protein
MTAHGTFGQRRRFFQSQARSSTAANFFIPANVTILSKALQDRLHTQARFGVALASKPECRAQYC